MSGLLHTEASQACGLGAVQRFTTAADRWALQTDMGVLVVHEVSYRTEPRRA